MIVATLVEPAELTRSVSSSSASNELATQLGAFIAPSRILTRQIDRIAFASDGSFYRLIPQAVVQPVNTEEIRKLFAFSHDKKIPLTFRAGEPVSRDRQLPMEFWLILAAISVWPM